MGFHKVNGRSASYTANTLNQYTQRDVPGAFDVLGSAATNATVTVNDQPVSRHGESFSTTLSLTNNVAPVVQDVKVYGLVNGAGPNGEDVFDDRSGKALLPKTPENFSHDLDGNLVSDGLWNYSWDAENRLAQMETLAAAVSAGAPKQKLEFAYDPQGRRIQKKIYTWDTQASAYSLQSTHLFAYDGWNLMAELNVNGTPIRTYTWGLDLSGSMQGAGGVGGLLAVQNASDSSTHFPAFDGNGNVVALVNAETGAVSAEYDYGPFGEPLRATGAMAKNNPFRFSTKYADQESGLVDYQLRPTYRPDIGRFVSRDPIGENGGVNLYGFVRNNPINLIDPWGLDTYTVNRTLNAFGNGAWNRNGLTGLSPTHTFTVTTNPDGTINHTYSWGNDANLHGWNIDRPEDRSAASEALRKGKAKCEGDSSLDPFVQKAYDELNNPANDHANCILFGNCKSETRNLLSSARSSRASHPFGPMPSLGVAAPSLYY